MFTDYLLNLHVSTGRCIEWVHDATQRLKQALGTGDRAGLGGARGRLGGLLKPTAASAELETPVRRTMSWTMSWTPYATVWRPQPRGHTYPTVRDSSRPARRGGAVPGRR